jgi:hypothetical protein
MTTEEADVFAFVPADIELSLHVLNVLIGIAAIGKENRLKRSS